MTGSVPVSDAQIWTVLSVLPETIRFPSGDHASTLIVLCCCVYVYIALPLLGFHTVTWSSPPPDAIRVASGDQTRDLTPTRVLGCAVNARICCPDKAFHICSSVSSQEAMC